MASFFGAFAQQSRFCLRSACIEFWRARPGPKFAIWLVTFSAALLLTQLQVWRGTLDTSTIRQLTATGSDGSAHHWRGDVWYRHIRRVVAPAAFWSFQRQAICGPLSPDLF
ncbi:MAG: hypothetical protein R3D29_03690 [Nitratireductor sp.]